MHLSQLPKDVQAKCLAQLRDRGIAVKGGAKKPRGMNSWERKFELVLSGWKMRGEILWYSWESIKLRLADKTWYTPDFPVVHSDHHLAFYEVKGFWRDDARVKIKVAAEQYPQFVFIAATIDHGQWQFEEFKARVA
jgi:hypothetical protein